MSEGPQGPGSQPQAAGGHETALRSFGRPNSAVKQFDFWDDRYESRRLFAEVLGTFLLVLVAAGSGMVNARFGGHVVPPATRDVAPALLLMTSILFLGTVSGAHFNPAITFAFALRGHFPWRRVPAYVVAQCAGAVLSVLLLWALIGRHGSAGLTLPGPGVSAVVALAWEVVLTAGLVGVVLGTASGAQQIGPFAAIGVAAYIAVAGLWGAPVSGASMNPVRSLAPALVLGDWTAWWAYLVGPLAGVVIGVGCAWLLRGPGSSERLTEVAQGTLGITWRLGRDRKSDGSADGGEADQPK